MRIKLQEFLDDNYKDIISGKRPPKGQDEIPDTHKTTDQNVRSTRQKIQMGFPGSYGYGGGILYERNLSEGELPYNTEADAMVDKPEEFAKFLESKGAADSFGSYFKPTDLKTKLKEYAKNKAIKMAEDIISKRKPSIDVIDNKPLPEIDDIKEKDELLFSKLDKIGIYIENNMSVQEKIVIDKYFNKLIHGE